MKTKNSHPFPRCISCGEVFGTAEGLNAHNAMHTKKKVNPLKKSMRRNRPHSSIGMRLLKGQTCKKCKNGLHRTILGKRTFCRNCWEYKDEQKVVNTH